VRGKEDAEDADHGLCEPSSVGMLPKEVEMERLRGEGM